MDMCHQSLTSLCHPSILQTRGCHLCDPSHSGMGGMHLCHLNPLAETSRGGSSPMSPSIQKHYPRVLQGLHRNLLRRGLCPPPPLQSVGPCHRAPMPNSLEGGHSPSPPPNKRNLMSSSKRIWQMDKSTC